MIARQVSGHEEHHQKRSGDPRGDHPSDPAPQACKPALPERAIRPFPGTGSFQKWFIAVLSNEFDRLPIFFIFMPLFRVKTGDYGTGGKVRTIGAGFEVSFTKTTDLHRAFRSGYVPFSRIISRFAAFAHPIDEWLTGCAKGSAASDEPYRIFRLAAR
jgi:hypothetical protein